MRKHKGIGPVILATLFGFAALAACSASRADVLQVEPSDIHSLSVEVGIGKNSSRGTEYYDWYDGGSPGARFALRYDYDPGGRWGAYIEASHDSQWLANWPFNDTKESSLDHIGIGVKFKLLSW